MVLPVMKLITWLRDLLARTEVARASELSSKTDVGESDDVDPFNPFPEPITIEITDVIDLHTIQPQDVKRVVEEYLLEAQAKRFRTVRIIHGKGIGVQREIVRTVLARTPFVDDWTDAPPDAGGLGATIASIKPWLRHDGGGE